MKKIYTIVLAVALAGTFASCDDFLDYNPSGVIDEDKAFNEPGFSCRMPLFPTRHIPLLMCLPLRLFLQD